jgi:ABC-type multidrug transport system fused ATPase/permease subunit
LNIDPFSVATDSEIIAALERVGLWSILSSRGGLTAEIVPDSLSRGQQQLLALARALLNKSKIVLLDEATSSVDKETEETLRKVMKEDFSDCTIISIAHRLETIMDYDVVAVMNKGRIVEFGRPAELMADEKSAFSLLWKGAGDVSLE